MRNMKRVLAAILAFTMAVGLCSVTSKMSVAHAEEEVAQTIEGKGEMVPIYLTGITATVPEILELPFNISIEIKATASKSVSVGQMYLAYKDTATGSLISFSPSFDNAWIVGETESKQTIELSFDEHVSAGRYELADIGFVQSENDNSVFQYTREENTDSFAVVGDADGKYAQYNYDKCADFTVGKNEGRDISAPEIKSVSIVTNPVMTGGEVEISLDYTTKGSAIKSVSADFVTADDKWEWFATSPEDEGKYTGSGTLNLTYNSSRALGDEYSLNVVRIEDCAGNLNSYYLNTDGTALVAADGQGNEAGRIPVVSYIVSEELPAEWLELTGIRIQDGVDKEQVGAGDSFDIIVTLKNNADKPYALTGGSLNAQWNCNGETEYVNISDYKDIMVEAGASTEVTLPFDISEFAQKGSYQWLGINYRVGEYYIYYNRNDMEAQGWVEKNGQTVTQAPRISYEETADFTVAKADKPDTEAPYIRSLRIGSSDIKAPGEVKIEVEVEDGNAKTNRISLQFEDTENTKNRIYISGYIWGANNSGTAENMYYSETKKCYVIEGTLGDQIAKGKYQLIDAGVEDKAKQYRSYGDIQDGVLTDYIDGTKLNSVIMEIAESERKDRDFEYPVLKSIEVVNKEVPVPGEIQYIVNAEDESGISNIHFQHKRSDGTYINFYADSITKDGDNYICKVKLGQYVWGGLCELSAVALEDGSAGKNTAYYSRRGSELYSGQNGLAAAYNGEADLSLKRSGEDASLIYITDQGLNSKLQAFQDGTLVTITGLYPAALSNSLSKEVMQIIKDKKLKIRLIMPSGKDQIVFDGAELTDEMVQEFYIVLGEKFKLSGGAEYANAIDEAGYGIYLEGRNNKIPMTIRVAVDEEFYQSYKENNIRFSKDTFGVIRYQIEKENLKMTFEEGEYFVDVPVDAGQELGDRYYCISTGTTKFFDYVIDTEAWIQSATNEVVKGNEFTYNMRISNDNEETLRNIVVYPEMLNRENGTEIDIAGKYQFSIVGSEARERLASTFANSDKVIITEDGDAVITELNKGEIVELSLCIQIPEAVETERVVLNTFAAIAKSDTELEAFGSTNVNLTLRQPKTVLKGDINEDGVIDASDLMYMLQVVSERISEANLSTEQVQAGDVSGADGKITADDLMKMLQFVSERITSLE